MRRTLPVLVVSPDPPNRMMRWPGPSAAIDTIDQVRLRTSPNRKPAYPMIVMMGFRCASASSSSFAIWSGLKTGCSFGAGLLSVAPDTGLLGSSFALFTAHLNNCLMITARSYAVFLPYAEDTDRCQCQKSPSANLPIGLLKCVLLQATNVDRTYSYFVRVVFAR